MSPRAMLAAAAFTIAALGLAPRPALAQGLIFVVRHAEKGAAPPGDPSLSAEGRQRALALRDLLREAGVKTIVTSRASRARETAQPLATALGLALVEDPMTDARGLVARIQALPDRGNVLVVGHSDSVPELLEALGHSPPITIDDGEFDNLFIVTPGEVTRPRVTRLRYQR